MADAEISTRIEGGTVQGIVGARTVIIENLVYGAAPLPASPAETSAKGELPPCPYPGLAWFGPQDRKLFFGREAAISRLLEAVPRQGMTALVGASGSGKSSVVLAGLAPRLADTGLWRFSHFRVGTETDRDPFASLSRALVPLFADDLSQIDRLGEVTKLAAKLKSGEISLPTVLGECRAKNSGRRILLIADQFEELFTLVPDEATRHRFVDVLLSGFGAAPTGNPPDVCLLMTLRADFYGMAVRHRPLSDALQGRIENLGPMTREELREAIEKPAGTVRFEPGLVETLLDDVTSRPGNLPLLQFALREMWFRQEKGTIGHQAYEAIGRVEGALARRAQEIFDGLTDKGANQQAVALFRRLFTRLVTLGEGVEDTRRVVDRGELGDEAWALAQRLAGEDNRLLVTTAPEPGHESAEVIHEALIRNWPTLVDWVNRDRAFQSYVRQLKARVEEWQAHPEDEGSLLRGAALAAAEDWLGKRREDFSAEEAAFVDASLAARNARRAKEEAERQTALKREQERAEAAAALARVRQRQSRFAWALAALSIVTVGFVGYFGWQAFLSSKAATEARNAALAAEDRALTAQVEALTKTAEVRYAQRRAEAERQAAEAAKAEAVAAREEAEAQANRAEAERERADEQLRETLRTQSLFLSDLAHQQAEKGDYGTALGLALEAAPRPTRALVQRPYVWQSEAALYEAIGGLREIQILRGHEDVVVSVAYSPDGTRVVSASDDGTARAWDAGSGEEELVLRGSDRPVRSAAYSPDGSKILTASEDGTASIWDASTGGLVRELEGAGDGDVHHAVFSPDGAKVLLVQDNTLSIFNAATGQSLRTTTDPAAAFRHAAFSPDGLLIVAASLEGKASVYNAYFLSLKRSLEGDAGVSSAEFSPDGKAVLTASAGGTAQIWDVETGAMGRSVSEQAELSYATFSADTKSILTVTNIGDVRIWSPGRNATPITLAGHDRHAVSAAFSPDGNHVATGARDSTVRLWTLRPPADPVEVGALEGTTIGIALSPDGTKVAASSWNGEAAILNADGSPATILAGHTSTVNTLAFSPDGARVVTASDDGSARIWSATTGRSEAVLAGGGPSIESAVFSPDGKLVLTASTEAQVWDAATGERVLTLSGMRRAGSATFSPDGSRILTASDDKLVRIWDAATGAEIRRLEGHLAGVNTAFFSADGRRIVSASEDGSARVWNAETGAEIAVLRAASAASAMRSAIFAPDGSRVVTWSTDDNEAVLWEAETGEVVARLPHTWTVRDVAYAPDGSKFMTVEDNGPARLWTADGNLLMTVHDPNFGPLGPGLSGVAMSADNQHVALGSNVGRVLLWRIFPTIQDLIDHANDVRPRGLSAEQRTRFFLSGH